MNVFEITTEYQELMMQIEDLGGEVTPELAERLAINEQNLKDKIHAYYFVIKTKEAEINLAKDEQERLNNVRKTKENVIKRLKNIVDLAVETFGAEKSSGAKGLDLGDLKVWQKKSIALDITGNIDDARFCDQEFKFQFRYSDANEFLKHIEGTKFMDAMSTNIIVDKNNLKSWLIDNEKEHKILRQKADEITNVEFEEDENFIVMQVKKEETQEEKDLKVIRASNIIHNSTVIFK